MRAMAVAVLVAVLLPSFPARADEPSSSDRPVQAQLTPYAAQLPVATAAQAPVPLGRRWYVWAAVAGTFAAAVTLGVVLAAQARPAPLTQAQVCTSGACDACIGLTCTP